MSKAQRRLIALSVATFTFAVAVLAAQTARGGDEDGEPVAGSVAIYEARKFVWVEAETVEPEWTAKPEPHECPILMEYVPKNGMREIKRAYAQCSAPLVLPEEGSEIIAEWRSRLDAQRERFWKLPPSQRRAPDNARETNRVIQRVMKVAARSCASGMKPSCKAVEYGPDSSAESGSVAALFATIECLCTGVRKTVTCDGGQWVERTTENGSLISYECMQRCPPGFKYLNKTRQTPRSEGCVSCPVGVLDLNETRLHWRDDDSRPLCRAPAVEWKRFVEKLDAAMEKSERASAKGKAAQSE